MIFANRNGLALVAFFALFPLLVHNDYYRHLLILAFMWVVIGAAWNLIAGFTGQVSFGDAAFFGTGAYTSGLLYTHYGWSPWWGVILGGLAAVVIAIPFGLICFRLRGAYFALATLALNEVMRHIATIWEDFTQGMVGIMILQTFPGKLPYYYIIFALAVFTLVAIRWIMSTRWGYYFLAIREDQDAAAAVGISTTRYKMYSLAVAAMLTGMAGGFYMNYMGFIDPKVVFSLHDISIMAILVGIVGGVGVHYGPAVGAFVMVVVQEFFRTGGFGLLLAMSRWFDTPWFTEAARILGKAHVLGFGILVVLVILYMPNGIAGDIPRLFRRQPKPEGDKP